MTTATALSRAEQLHQQLTEQGKATTLEQCILAVKAEARAVLFGASK